MTTTVDLRRPPSERWAAAFTDAQCQQARELMASYRKDLNLPDHLGQMLGSVVEGFLKPDHWQELDAVARQIGVPLNEAVVGNLYYDLFKVVLGRTFGCTAFAVENAGGILHARNLDWPTENGALSRYTLTTRFVNGPAGEFTTVGWPGFLGAFSGVAPGRFAVTLNAVLSMEPAQLATPVVFLLRTALEESPTFDAALKLLSETPIPCDCLLLLTGIKPGELAVIERTPSRHAIRRPAVGDGFVAVTNGYSALKANEGQTALGGSSCGRFDRISALVKSNRPATPEECLRYLRDPDVRMQMTVQQMVFCAATGEHVIRS